MGEHGNNEKITHRWERPENHFYRAFIYSRLLAIKSEVSGSLPRELRSICQVQVYTFGIHLEHKAATWWQRALGLHMLGFEGTGLCISS